MSVTTRKTYETNAQIFDSLYFLICLYAIDDKELVHEIVNKLTKVVSNHSKHLLESLTALLKLKDFHEGETKTPDVINFAPIGQRGLNTMSTFIFPLRSKTEIAKFFAAITNDEGYIDAVSDLLCFLNSCIN